MNLEPFFLKKKDLCIIENWKKDIHGSSNDPQFDKFLSTRKINYTSFNDEYDINSRNNLFDFIWLIYNDDMQIQSLKLICILVHFTYIA